MIEPLDMAVSPVAEEKPQHSAVLPGLVAHLSVDQGRGSESQGVIFEQPTPQATDLVKASYKQV